jgi:alpha-L-rhamnosidase
MHNLAYEAMNKKEEPGYGRWIELGATTTWEKWDISGSHNHPMFGGGLVWYYRKLAGMNTDSDQPGYRHIIFKPQPVDDLSFAKYFNYTSYGEAGILWQKEYENLSMDITVPVGCHATVYIPVKQNQKVFESGKSVEKSELIKALGDKEGCKVYTVNSGTYKFSVNQ